VITRGMMLEIHAVNVRNSETVEDSVPSGDSVSDGLKIEDTGNRRRNCILIAARMRSSWGGNLHFSRVIHFRANNALVYSTWI
jgi:hypothetical protein